MALTLALLVHALLGVAMKYNPLVAATAVPAASSPPVTLRFVEVPEGAKTVPAPSPGTKYASDANRKAGPLEPNKIKPRDQQIRQYPSIKGRASNSVAAADTPAPRESSEPAQSNSSKPADDPGSVPSPKLAEGALKDLDRFIGTGGTGTSGSGGGTVDQEGTMPAGDPGSGVFFDTQGYDLGPWGNHVIAIVKKNWIVPVAAELGLKGVVAISFQVDRSGKILNPKIISSSEVPSFNQAALQALMISNPFPALPADFPRPNLPAVFRFYYNIPVPE